MDFYRAKENDLKFVKYENSFNHNTALIAGEGQNVVGVLEYDIKNMEEAEIINFNIFESCEEDLVFKGLINEMVYWNPYFKRIIYNEEENIIKPDILTRSGFIKNSLWLLIPNTNIEVFKIDIKEITPEQLTVDEVKVKRVSSWIQKPEDIVINCVKIGDKLVSIDGHSRLVAAYNRGFEYVYAFIESDTNKQFYEVCLGWCEEQGIHSIKDLAKRVVTSAEHERFWINRCQTYLKQQK